MALVKVLKDYGSSEQFEVGEIVDITNPEKLLEEGHVELYIESKVSKKKTTPVAPQKATEVSEKIQ